MGQKFQVPGLTDRIDRDRHQHPQRTSLGCLFENERRVQIKEHTTEAQDQHLQSIGFGGSSVRLRKFDFDNQNRKQLEQFCIKLLPGHAEHHMQGRKAKRGHSCNCNARTTSRHDQTNTNQIHWALSKQKHRQTHQQVCSI